MTRDEVMQLVRDLPAELQRLAAVVPLVIPVSVSLHVGTSNMSLQYTANTTPVKNLPTPFEMLFHKSLYYRANFTNATGELDSFDYNLETIALSVTRGLMDKIYDIYGRPAKRLHLYKWFDQRVSSRVLSSEKDMYTKLIALYNYVYPKTLKEEDVHAKNMIAIMELIKKQHEGKYPLRRKSRW
jgi:hypothetical protein